MIPLMSRIKVNPFLAYTYLEKQELIASIQLKRINSIEEAKIKKAGKLTKTKRKARKRKGRTVNTKASALKALEKLSPEELLKTLEMFE